MKKKLLCSVSVVVMIVVLYSMIGYNTFARKADACEETNYNEYDYEQRAIDNSEPEDVEVADLSYEQKSLYDVYEKIPSEQLETFRAMSDDVIDAYEQNIICKYEIGEKFSEYDTNFILYVKNERSKIENITRAGVTRKHTIKNSKTELGVKAGYDGYLETWSGHANSQYGANVKCTLSKTVKSAKFKVHHAAYGVLGWNGNAPSVGKVYDNTLSSSSYKQSFTFKKFKKYSSILPVYVTTWGELIVGTDKGEFNVKSKLYKTIE